MFSPFGTVTFTIAPKTKVMFSKFSVQWFLGSLGWTSVSYDWTMVINETSWLISNLIRCFAPKWFKKSLHWTKLATILPKVFELHVWYKMSRIVHSKRNLYIRLLLYKPVKSSVLSIAFCTKKPRFHCCLRVPRATRHCQSKFLMWDFS